MAPEFDNIFQEFKKSFQAFAQSYIEGRKQILPELGVLWESIQYSLDSGGKRFRPFLCYLIAKSFKKSPEKIIPFALAVEFIHTYSLIHDDLPCLDNDDYRRGKPTNHKVFGEDIALLSGDALLTEAFSIISESYRTEPDVAISLVQLLSQKIGSLGMVAGQILDMKVSQNITHLQLEKMHQLKTGALIEASVLGAAIIHRANKNQIQYLQKFSMNLGLAFQIKDDLLDGMDSQQDFKNYLSILGPVATEVELKLKTQASLDALASLVELQTDDLRKLALFNQNRSH